MLDAQQVLLHVVRPALDELDLWSKKAEALVIGTAAQESKLCYLSQLGAGPALGLWQIEPATHEDIWENYLTYRPERAKAVLAAAGVPDYVGTPPAEWLIFNLRYSAAMCRVHYVRVPAPLPDEDDVEAMGKYWKRYYNGPGDGTVAQFVESYAQLWR